MGKRISIKKKKNRKNDFFNFNVSNFNNYEDLVKLVKKNKDIFIEPITKTEKIEKFSNLVPFLFQFLDNNEESFGIWLKNFPFCVISRNAHDHIIRNKGKIKGEKKKECQTCKFFRECCGFPQGYFKKYGTSEIKPIDDIPEEIMIEIEPKCNFKCQFCFNKISFAKKGRNINRLSCDYIKEIINEISKIGISAIRFTGGEPLLYSEIFLAMKYAKKKNIKVRLNTNGSLIDKKMAHRLKGIVDDIIISVESWSNAEEEKITGYPDALNKKIQAINSLKKITKAKIISGTVATKKTIKDFKKIFRLLEGLRVDEWFFLRPILSGSDLSKRDISNLVDKICKIKKTNHLSVSLANAIPFCSVKNTNRINSISSGALYDEGHTRMVIDPRGFVKPHYFIDKNIGDPLDIFSAWNHSFMKKMRNLEFLPKNCKKCNFRCKCRGGSRHLAYLASGKYNDSDPLADYSNCR